MFIKNVNQRINLVAVVSVAMLIACLAFVIKLAFVQKGKYNGDREIYKYYTQDQFDTLSDSLRKNCVIEEYVNPTRGTIYDDHGRPLVTSVRVYPIGVDGRNFNTKHEFFPEGSPYLDTLVNDLARMFFKQFGERYPKYTYEYYRDQLGKALKNHKRVQLFKEHEVVVYKQMIVDKDIDAIRSMPVFSRTIKSKDLGRYGLAGREKIRFPNILDKGGDKLTVRLRPYGDMASRILGDPKLKNGIDGCAMFNPILTGEAGVNRRLYMNGISIPLSNENPPVEGGDIHTTLNVEIQKYVHQALLEQCYVAKPKWGCAIVMETATGDIKGISNFECKINNGDTTYVETRNYAMVADVSEPGSTFKLASLLAYLEKFNGDTTRKYNIFQSDFKVGKRVYHKVDKKGVPAGRPASVKEIIQRSSNVGVVNMMRDAYPKFSEYVDKLNSMYITVGYNAQIGKLPPIGNLRPETRIFEEQYSRYFGAAFNMQPMQTLVYYNAVANGGKMMQPRFVKSSHIEGKDTEYPTVVIAEQIASKKSIEIAQDILHAVVAEAPGTARNAARRVAPGLDFSGKTGTRDIYDVQLGGYNKNRNAVSFCGYFPAKKPQYTCVVYLYDAPYPASSANAITVFANVAQRILNPPQKMELNDSTVYFKHPVQPSAVNRLIAKYNLKIKKASQQHRYCIVRTDTPDKPQAADPHTGTGKIPNVIGLNASDAVSELRKAGYKARIKGCGTVRSQSVDNQNKTVMLVLSTG